jgi:hypothetical protein
VLWYRQGPIGGKGGQADGRCVCTAAANVAKSLLDYGNINGTLLTWLCRGVAAMSIHSFVTPGVFHPEALAAMGEAFEAACEALDDTGQPQIVREVIAQRIIEAARRGERDPVRLVEAALPWLTRE